jgi:hypothetical protein
MPSNDACIRVTIPQAGRWTFTTCDNGGDGFNTHMFIGTTACSADICESEAGSSDACGGTQAECRCVILQAGQYFVTIEGDFSNNGQFFFQVSQCSGNCYDFAVTAPFTTSGNTCNMGNDCPLASGEDVIYRVTIPTSGYWNFSTCGSGGAHDSFRPFLYIGHDCCTADVCQSQSSDFCGNPSNPWAACPCVELTAGVYYVTLDQAAGFCSEYQLSVQPGNPSICNPPPPQCWDYSLSAPGSMNGNTDQLNHNNCNLMPGVDASVKVTIPHAGNWTFSTCDNGGDGFNTHMFIGTECCTANICENAFSNSNACGGTQAECRCVSLDAGTYYVTIEGDFQNSGAFFLNVTECANCYDFVLNAPGERLGANTCDYGNDYFGAGDDVVIKVNIPSAGYWTFTNCYGDNVDYFQQSLFLGTSCGDSSLGVSRWSDYCNDGSHQWAAIPCVYLQAGSVYLTVDAAAGCGNYGIHVFEDPNCGSAPCTASDAIVFEAALGTQQHACAHLCPGVATPIHVFGPVPVDPTRPPIISIQSGCNFGENGCNSNCSPATQWNFSSTGWVFTQGYWMNSIFGMDSGCVCITFDSFLPVELQSFTADAGDSRVTVRWTTASEQRNDHFEIQRNGVTVANVASLGNDASGHNYSWTDTQLQNGQSYRYTLISVDLSGARETLRTVEATPIASASTVTDYALHQNYPNPFNPTTEIAFDLKETGFVTLTVYNLSGQKVATLVNSEMPRGRHTVSFGATALPSGMYIYKMDVNGYHAQQKMLLMK